MTRALLITNPAAARTAAGAVGAIRDALRAGGWNVEVQATGQAGDARRFAEQARDAGIDVVVCHGGDGTAMQMAAAIAGSGVALGLVPGGTGNLLAGNLYLPRDPAAAARVMLRGNRMAIDLGIVERDVPHYFAVCCGAGFDARLMADTQAAIKRRWKRYAYLARGMVALPNVRSTMHRVTIDDVVHERRAALVLVINCGDLFPPFLRLRNDIAPDDGWFDVLTLDADGTFASFAAFWELMQVRWSPRPHVSKRVWFARGRSVRVEVLEGPEQPVQLDGEVCGGTPFETRLVPGALSVLVDTATVQRRYRHD